MEFFYTRDRKHRYRFFSSEPVRQIPIRFTRWEKVWEAAKQKLMLLPRRVLAQEQAFARIRTWPRKDITIRVSGCLGIRKTHRRFFLFLQKQRTKHIFLLVVEMILLPISGIMAFLPGPNVFFGVLALIMITHWQAFRGINRLSRLRRHFSPTPLLRQWEQAVDAARDNELTDILNNISLKYRVEKIRSIL